MKITFLGVGEAFDEDFVNNSHIVHSDTVLLMDCGYSVPRHLWKNFPDKDFLDAVYLSHAHADHYLGIPVLLARMQDEKRVKPFKIITQPDIINDVLLLIEYAHRNLSKKLSFPIEYIDVEKNIPLTLNDLLLDFAPTMHSTNNFAIKITHNQKSVCYSGDGDLTDESKKLFSGTDLLIHESFTLESPKKGHACVKDLVEVCDELSIKNLALTHLNRKLRKEKYLVEDFIKSRPTRAKIFIPEPMDTFML